MQDFKTLRLVSRSFEVKFGACNLCRLRAGVAGLYQLEGLQQVRSYNYNALKASKCSTVAAVEIKHGLFQQSLFLCSTLPVGSYPTLFWVIYVYFSIQQILTIKLGILKKRWYCMSL